VQAGDGKPPSIIGTWPQPWKPGTAPTGLGVQNCLPGPHVHTLISMNLPRVYAAASMNTAPDTSSTAAPAPADTPLPAGFRHVSRLLAELGHAHAPRLLDVAARTSQEAADALGIQVGQIAKSVIFRRKADDRAVLVVTSGDQRVDERKVAALVCAPGSGGLGRADAAFVKASSGFSIGGVAPLGHTLAPVTLIDRELFRFDLVWAAAGHPNGVFATRPQDLIRLTGGAPVEDVVQLAVAPAAPPPGAST
jgi:prolyl-tRNA editing enzyme YbaK/EbsC (Cys-tRNA(Pro) deacylase)